MEGKEIPIEEIQDIPKTNEKSIHTPKTGSKHRLLNTVGAGLLSLTTAVGAFGSAQPVRSAEENTSGDPIPTEIVPNDSEINPAKQLLEFTEAKGHKDLTFEEAKDFVKPTAVFFAGLDTRFTAEEIEKKTFIIRGDALPEDNEFRYTALDVNGDSNKEAPVFQRIKKDYPDIVIGKDINNDSIRHIANNLQAGRVIAFVDHDTVFLFLDRLNGERRNAHNMYYEFDSLDDRSCRLSTPSNMFINTALHEFAHLDQPYEEGAIHNPGLRLNADIMTRNDKKYEGHFPTSVETNAFQLRFEYKGWRRDFFSTFPDEFVVEHIATKLSVDNELKGVTIGTNGPLDSYNFNVILDQAGISTQDLLEYHRNSDLEGFITKVAGAAEGVEFSSEEEKLRFGLRLFRSFLDGKLVWEKRFKPYFPGIDLSGYDRKKPHYVDNAPFPGCGIPGEDKMKDKTTKNKTSP